MTGVGAARLLPVVLALVLGVLGMHALVIVEAGHSAPAHAAMQSAPADSAPVHVGLQAAPAHPGQHADRVAPGPGPATGDPPSGTPGHGDHRDHLLHLCAAVLGGLIVLLAGLVLLGRLHEPDAVRRACSRHGRRAPARPPPATSVRLARLCVSRT